MVTNLGKRITFFHMAAIFGRAYLKMANCHKAVNGFSSCGHWPLDENIFIDEDFAASIVTDETASNTLEMMVKLGQIDLLVLT